MRKLIHGATLVGDESFYDVDVTVNAEGTLLEISQYDDLIVIPFNAVPALIRAISTVHIKEVDDE